MTLFCILSTVSLSRLPALGLKNKTAADEDIQPQKANTTSLEDENHLLGLSVSNASHTNSTTTGKKSVEDTHRCSVHEQQYCHNYIKNIFVLYTGTGGWVMLGIIAFGVLLQVHFLLSGRNVSYVQYRRNDLRYFMRNKKSLRFLVIDRM